MPDEMMRVVDRWRANAERHPDREAIVFRRAGEEPFRWTFEALMLEAERIAPSLIASGVRRGDVCGLVLTHGPGIYPLYVALKLAGAVPAILAHPNPRIHPEKFRDGLRGMSRRSGLDWILTEPAFVATVDPLVSEDGSLVRGVLTTESVERGEHALDVGETNHAEPLLLQHSSGTTGLQKAVTLSNEAVARHLENYARAIRLSEADKVASWLPLYHDMGLIAAFHLPLYHGITSIQLDPFEWVMAPVLLLEAMSEEKATITWLPNFAYNVIADRAHEDELATLDLSHVRLVINCSEPIRAQSHSAFVQKLAPAGLRESALGCSYAMAETTFAVTQSVPGAPPRVLVVDRDELRKGVVTPVHDAEEPRARPCVSSGQAIPGCDVMVVDEDGRAVPDGRVGEIVVSSQSMFDGYRNWPEKTKEVLSAGWFRTGDLGFRWDDEIFVSGRKKDIIIVAGKNIYPEDIEDVVSTVKGVLPGRVLACGLDDAETGTERVCVIAESNGDGGSPDEIAACIKAAVAAIDVTVSEVAVVPPRWLIKSSAGKPSRSANRERVERMIADGGDPRDF